MLCLHACVHLRILGATLADSCQSAFTAAVWCCAWLLAFKVAARVAAGFLLPLGSLPSGCCLQFLTPKLVGLPVFPGVAKLPELAAMQVKADGV